MTVDEAVPLPDKPQESESWASFGTRSKRRRRKVSLLLVPTAIRSFSSLRFPLLKPRSNSEDTCEPAVSDGPSENIGEVLVTQRRLLPHAARCSYIMLNGLVTDNGMEGAYHNLGDLYSDQGKLVEAKQMYQRVLQGYEKAWGPEHTSTLDTVNNLGDLYANQGKLVEAEREISRLNQIGLVVPDY